MSENCDSDSNIILNHDESTAQNAEKVKSSLSNKKFESILCLSGGFDIGAASDKDVFEKYERLDKMNF